MGEEEKGITFTISGIKDRIVVYGFALLVSGATIADFVIPKRPDPFTGTEGNVHEDRIDVLEMEHSIFIKSIEDCKEHRDKLEYIVESLVIDMATVNQKQISNKYLIERCMSITGN